MFTGRKINPLKTKHIYINNKQQFESKLIVHKTKCGQVYGLHFFPLPTLRFSKISPLGADSCLAVRLSSYHEAVAQERPLWAKKADLPRAWGLGTEPVARV